MTDIINTFVFPIVRCDYILDALKSLHYFTPPNYQTIVVDQTQPDAEFEEQLRALCDVHVKTRVNYGFAQGTNIGWRLAQNRDEDYIDEVFRKCHVWYHGPPGTTYGSVRLHPTEYLTTCNDDVVFVWGGWWDGIIASFEKYDTAVCVNPMSPREPGWGYGQEGFIEHLTFKESIYPKNIERLVAEKNGQMIDGLTCWCSVFKTSAIDELGMFDERWWPGGGEDYDMMGRVYAAGYRALATSLSWVYHIWGQSKDEPDGLSQAQPPAREYWNKLNVAWPDGFDVWAKDKDGNLLKRTPEVVRMSL